MKTVTPFIISEFTNPSEKIVFQLYARIDGQRFRKNFKTRREAEAERQVQEVSWLQRDTGTRAAITRLIEDQLHEAETVFRRLASPRARSRSTSISRSRITGSRKSRNRWLRPSRNTSRRRNMNSTRISSRRRK